MAKKKRISRRRSPKRHATRHKKVVHVATIGGIGLTAMKLGTAGSNPYALYKAKAGNTAIINALAANAKDTTNYMPLVGGILVTKVASMAHVGKYFPKGLQP